MEAVNSQALHENSLSEPTEACTAPKSTPRTKPASKVSVSKSVPMRKTAETVRSRVRGGRCQKPSISALFSSSTTTNTDWKRAYRLRAKRLKAAAATKKRSWLGTRHRSFLDQQATNLLSQTDILVGPLTTSPSEHSLTPSSSVTTTTTSASSRGLSSTLANGNVDTDDRQLRSIGYSSSSSSSTEVAADTTTADANAASHEVTNASPRASRSASRGSYALPDWLREADDSQRQPTYGRYGYGASRFS